MEWFAELVYSFKCPDCGQRIPEGNPKACPHQQGPGARFTGKKPVVNAAKLIAVLSSKPKAGLTEGKTKTQSKSDATAPRPSSPPPVPKPGVTIDDALKAECPKGG